MTPIVAIVTQSVSAIEHDRGCGCPRGLRYIHGAPWMRYPTAFVQPGEPIVEDTAQPTSDEPPARDLL
jgi:hypothetical protein